MCPSVAVLLFVASASYGDTPGHDTFDPAFRAPGGAISFDQGSVTLRLFAPGASSARLRVWDSAISQEIWKDLSVSTSFVAGTWEVEYPIPVYPTILYYTFEATFPLPGGTNAHAKREHSFTRYQVCRDPQWHAGGKGIWIDARDDMHSFRITVYDPAYDVPDWLQGAFIYQIFPDSFRDGDPSNNPTTADDRDHWYLGGDLQGILEEIDYLKNLGVTAIYLNPIFLAGSYHRYDTQDYLEIDPILGDLGTFDQLVAAAHSANIRLILDGVFNHTAADSPYFNYFGRFDDLGACESANSSYRSWYFLPHVQTPGSDDNGLVYCPPGSKPGPGSIASTYEAWSGDYNLPKLNARSPGVRDLFFTRNDSVAPYWVGRGASGFRLDASGLVDRGSMNEPDNLFWSGMRKAIRAVDPDAVMIGEEWGYATPWLLGRDLDSVMNYRFRSALLNWMFDSCQGQGCVGGKKFTDNDSNDQSVLGPIVPASESEFLDQLGSIAEDTPPQSLRAMMNLVDSHDTSRILWSLKKISLDQPDVALRKLELVALFQLTYPGAPTVYYGDEAGLTAEDVWTRGTWQDDPYNRLPYPWKDQGGSGGNPALIAYYAKLGNLRALVPALRTGAFEPVLVDDSRRILVFARDDGSSAAFVALNRNAVPQGIRFSSPSLGPEGSRYLDALTGTSFTVRAGALDLGQLPGLRGMVLTRQ